jgi:hypothetical protein
LELFCGRGVSSSKWNRAALSKPADINMRRTAMRRINGVIGIVAGVLACGPFAEASEVVITPVASARWVIETAEYTGSVDEHIVQMKVLFAIRLLEDGREIGRASCRERV